MKRRIRSILLHIALGALACVAMFPFAWLVWMALQSPDGPTLAHFGRAITELPLATWMLNSLFLASSSTVLMILIASLAGFALAKYRFRYRRRLIAMMLATMLLPVHLLLPGSFDLIVRLHLSDSYLAVVLPTSISIFATLLYARSMQSIPNDLLDAARLDGAREWRLWWDIALPAARPVTAAVLLTSFLGNWNSFVWPQLVLHSESKQPLPVALANLSALPGYQSDLSLLMALTLIGILPVVALFFALQTDLIRGLTAGAIRQ
jgi:multiple sugar transport system permease protein